jgi:hypothetical protein
MGVSFGYILTSVPLDSWIPHFKKFMLRISYLGIKGSLHEPWKQGYYYEFSHIFKIKFSTNHIIFGLISLQGILLKWIIKRLRILGGH